jgi:hypothetical protein
LQPFDVIAVRKLTDTFLYDRIDDRLGTSMAGTVIRDSLDLLDDYNLNVTNSNWARAVSIVKAYKQFLAQQAVTKERESFEGQVKYQLEFVGATLKSLEEYNGGYEVSWEYDGRTFNATINNDLTVRSAGCLIDHGNDNIDTTGWHNLTTLVNALPQNKWW